MGYYSTFRITTDPDLFTSVDVDEFETAINDVIGYKAVYHFNDNGITVFYISESKWYDWDTDILKVSRKYPFLTIRIEQVGEDGDGAALLLRSGDILERYERGWVKV